MNVDHIRDIIKAAVAEAVADAIPDEHREYIRHQVEKQRRRDSRLEALKRQIVAAVILGSLGWLFTQASKLALAILKMPGIKPLVETTWLGKIVHLETLL